MIQLVLVNGLRYIGRGVSCVHGSKFVVSDDIGRELLAVRDIKGLYRFEQVKAPRVIGSEPVTVADFVARLKSLNIPIPVGAKKKDLADLYAEAISGGEEAKAPVEQEEGAVDGEAAENADPDTDSDTDAEKEKDDVVI